MYLKRLTVLLYVTIILFIGTGLIMFSLQLLDFNDLFNFTYALYHDKDLRTIVGIIGGGIVLCNFIFYRTFSVNVHRDKIIAFDNPSGRVSVSLMAMEDLVKKILLKIGEVKDARVRIVAKKKGLDVSVRLILKSVASIPDMTARIQERIKRKIQDTIGLEEPVNVSIYVGKIIMEKVNQKETAKDEAEEPVTPTVPFRGFRA